MTRLLHLSVVLLLVTAGPLVASEPAGGFPSLCPLLLHQEEREREEIELAAALARSERRAAAEIFTLAQRLKEQELIEELLYEGFKHDRDATALAVELQERQGLRQAAVLELYRGACGEGRRGDGGRAQADYRAADCDILSTRAAIAEVDLEYSRAVLASFLDLRENDVATKQQVIVAGRNVEMAEKRLADGVRRAAACREALEEPDSQ